MENHGSFTNNYSSQLTKFIECLFVSVAIWNFYNSMILYPLTIMFPGVTGVILILRVLNIPLIVLGIAFAFIYPIYWHRREIKKEINSLVRHSWFRGIIRYWLAIEICNYGFAKILGTQFGHMYFRDNTLAKDLSGYDLTWFYFGHSYMLSIIVALTQIGGSIMLLFRRTVFTGALILLPVMTLIVLIDIFYNVYWDATMNAVLFTLGLLYLLFLFKKEIKTLFSQAINIFPKTPLGSIKYFLRFAAVVYAFIFIYYFTTTRSPAYFPGKWNVELLARNGDTINSSAWITDSTQWKNVYFETYPRVTITSNPYVIDAKHSRSGTYNYDSTKQKIRLMLWQQDNKKDTFDFYVVKIDKSHMNWTSVSQKDNVFLKLIRVE
jgi:hypothetical protein